MLRFLATLGILISFVSGCGGSSNVKTDSSSPLKKGANHYTINLTSVNLTLGDGAIAGDTTFASQETLKSQFEKSLNDNFSSLNILASDPTKADAIAEIQINYLRKFNYGGKALNKPEVGYTVKILKEGKVLTSWSRSRITTSYGYFKDAAVNLQIGAFKWGAEDEPKDVDRIANVIATEVSAIGK